MSREELLF